MKKIISMMLVLVFVFTLSACGKKDTSSDTDTSTPTQSETFVAPENYASVLLVTINPQFKLYLDENYNVLAVEPVNNDAKTFSADIDFENKSLEIVIGIIVEKANEKGFVKENATVNFEIAEQKSETVNKEDILQKAVSAAEQKAAELKITISAESTNDTEKTESTAGNNSSNTSKPANNTSKPNESGKPATSTPTPSTNKPATSKPSATTPPSTNTSTECKHNIKYTFDNIANTWSHSGQCTLCKQSFNNNVACEDKNKDNKCDTCSAKMDFGTAYQNVGYGIDEILWLEGNPSYMLKTVFNETKNHTKVINTGGNYFEDISYYSAPEFEKVAKSLFNIDDTMIAEMRKLQQKRVISYDEDFNETETAIVNLYDSTTNTYSYAHPAYGGDNSPTYHGYKKISDTEYYVYANSNIIKCTYTDTVKISSIEHTETIPSDLIKFK